MTERRETILHLLVFGLALAIRLVLLGARPLDDSEASLALQALELARGQSASGSQAGYLLGTGGLFALLGAGPFGARLLPALAGSGLVLAPLFLRRLLGRRAALILALGFAFDPGLLALSRQANGVMLAACFGGLALAAWLNGRRVWAGVLAGLGLLGGPQVWPGLLALAAAAAALRGKLQPQLRAGETGETGEDGHEAAADGLIRNTPVSFWAALGLTVLAAGTFFLRVPGGLGVLVDSLPVYLSSWAMDDPFRFLPAGVWLRMLPFYAPIPLVFGSWGALRGFRRSGEAGSAVVDRFLGILFLSGLVLGLLNPGREPAGWVWALVPLWALAARTLARTLPFHRAESFPVLAQATLTMLLLAFSWMTLRIFANQLSAGKPLSDTTGREVVGGALLLLAVTTVLMAWGWSRRAAGRGLALGLTAALALYTLSAAAGAGGLRSPATAELWRPWGSLDQLDLALQTVHDLSLRHTGSATAAGLQVAMLDSPALRWALRGYEAVSFSDSLPSGVMPDLMITPISAQQPALAAAYRGQDFSLVQHQNWAQLDSLGWLSWVVTREISAQADQIIVWGRTDLFPDSAPAESADSVP